MQSTREICNTYTNLTEIEIYKVEQLAKHLPEIASLNNAFVFIDCPAIEPDHFIVVAEAWPNSNNLLYQTSVLAQNVYKKFEPAVFKTLDTGESVYQHRAVSQEGRVVEQNVTPIAVNERIIGALIMEKDVSNKVLEEDKLKALTEATDTLSKIVSQSSESRIGFPDMIEESIFNIDQDLYIRYYNLTADELVKKILRVNCETDMSFIELFPSIEDMLTDGQIITIEEREFEGCYFRVKCIRLFEHNEVTGHLILMQDITDLKEKEKELISKSVAIREVHHRVKNNLQTVASLLRLQMRRGLPDDSKIYFQESLNRILSIASVYEVILDESHTDKVNIGKLIKKIGNMLVYNDNSEACRIHISYHINQTILLPSNTAVSLALIANELISNCIKHAFDNKDVGNIDVKLIYTDSDNEMILVVQDDGGDSLDFEESFGLNIINTITENDLGGSFKLTKNRIGTMGKVNFQHKGSNSYEENYGG
ncbi:sensor histidine kinase [Staphylococcus gallinarum]|uniref:sensor histidine kinase n=1 Tax=Staphylococcus gallinarum TaxID=1293 RepID=UPI001F540174|nr:sensor histidine kinase [Staphylococcus gallinarum]